MHARRTVADGQRTFSFPPPTIEERIANVPEEQKPLARKVEKERGNIRFALHWFLTHGTPKIQKEADRLLQCLHTIDPVSLANGVRNMHYPKELRGSPRKGPIALGTMHRALAEYWQTDLLHIHRTLRELLNSAKTLQNKNASKRTRARNNWDLLHAGMRDLMD